MDHTVPICCVPVLGTGHARIFANLVEDLIRTEHELVQDRGHFSTLGNAHYVDDKVVYLGQTTRILNSFLDLFFRGLLDLCSQYVEEIYRVKNDHEWYSPKLAMPGFHVFDHRSNGIDASIHTDQPVVEEYWENLKVLRNFTYTLVLALPKCGGGLNVWYPDPATEETGVMKIKPDHYLNYRVGYLYTHEGKLWHQIANPGDLGDDEYRITLQGHVLHLENGQNLFYF